MYFKEKGNTNIDDQFKNTNKLNLSLSLKNPKTLLFLVIGIVLLGVIIFAIILIINNSNKPIIKLTGDESITITQGSKYVEPGYQAFDKDNNDITEQVKVTNNVDTSKQGEYKITYSVGKSTKVRYVTVTDAVDETYIYLKGKVNMYLEKNEKYIEPGYQVYDSIDKELSNKVKVTGKVDSSKLGTYQLTYTVVNSRNKTITAKRTIIVVEKGKKPKN